MALLDTIARKGRAFAAGYQGQGERFLKELDQQRKEAMAQDALRIQQMLESGDDAGASNLLLNRMELLDRLGADPSDTKGLFDKIQSGDIGGALRDATTVVEGAQLMGILPGVQRKVVGGQVVSVDPLTGEAKASDIEGLQTPQKAPKSTVLKPGEKEFVGGQLVAENVGDAEAKRIKMELDALKAANERLKGAKTQLEIEEAQKKAVDARKALNIEAESSIGAVQDAIDTTTRALTGPGLESAAGFDNFFPTFSGTKAADFEATLETLKSQGFLSQVSKMRGLGALGEKEGQQLVKAIGALDLSMKDKTLRSEITRIRNKMIDARARLEKRYGLPVSPRPADIETPQQQRQGGRPIVDVKF